MAEYDSFEDLPADAKEAVRKLVRGTRGRVPRTSGAFSVASDEKHHDVVLVHEGDEKVAAIERDAVDIED
ncbi:hypothetical protein EFA46_000565 [Halarchaeum sp. CBA1220]|uniref:hypothetical protein n=1 Tax=Halarchaeum sp. CBA1220 TaxID=1853682 RepID=UPI000F3A9FB0|nr:hypothetical protein [Halarchaeum sp. CBA1220]QLC32761.1 hypothetical protein EFA46_000565 [Halarchaeum sp. CBA1220]